MAFKRASTTQSKLRLAISGAAGAGKTYSALAIASGLGARVAVVDTERGSASKYASTFTFDVQELRNFHPDRYIEAIREAEAGCYDVVVIDSLSHAWSGIGGVLEIVDSVAKRSTGGKDTWSGWQKATPLQNRLVDTILSCKAHVICTMRSKTEWVLEPNDKGKLAPRKLGTAPVQRNGLEYEFDVVGELLEDNQLLVSKTRCSLLHAATIEKPGAPLAELLLTWLSAGAAPAPAPEKVATGRPADAPPMPPGTVGPAAPPPATAGAAPVRDRKWVLSQISAAATQGALEALVPDIQALAEADRNGVRPPYMAKLAQLSGTSSSVGGAPVAKGRAVGPDSRKSFG